MSKLIQTDTTLVDILLVAKALPEDEVEQIEAFGGNADPESIAVGLMQSHSMMWTLRLDDTGEPLAVGGYVQTGPTVFRSFFLHNPRLFDEYGSEATKLVAQTIKDIAEQFEYVRLETYCLPSREKAREWYEKIGLTFDAELDGFGVQGAAAVVYSKVSKASQIKLATPADVYELDKRKVN